MVPGRRASRGTTNDYKDSRKWDIHGRRPEHGVVCSYGHDDLWLAAHIHCSKRLDESRKAFGVIGNCGSTVLVLSEDRRMKIVFASYRVKEGIETIAVAKSALVVSVGVL
mmetsp:Transcript_43479/g.67807  ORF Transcript_43479/g.67807 Transcript_43479/m.67807 type:complete len:110 (-) Transcript_43479:11-340(-)